MMKKPCRLSCCASPQKKNSCVKKKIQKSKAKRKLPYLSVGEKQTISALRQTGLTFDEVGSVVGCDRTTAIRVMQGFNKTGTFDNKPKTGRPKAVTAEKEAEIIRLCEEDRLRTAGEINAMMREQDADFRVADRHVRRILQKNGLNGRVCSRKPLLRPANKVKRMRFARKHVNKPVSFWRRVLFSDEKKIELFNTKRRKYCRRRNGEPLRDDTIQPTVKHGGGSIMIWACMMGERTGDLYHVKGILEKKQMHKILQHHAIPSGLRLGGRGFLFQQDNDPKHTSKLCKNYIQSKIDNGTLINLEWPSQSPDLNPLELIWDEIDRQVQKQKPTSIPALKELVERLPRVLKAVIEAEGGYFNEKYAPRKFKHQEVY
jgi:transposase